jgi:hypothetical protein
VRGYWRVEQTSRPSERPRPKAPVPDARRADQGLTLGARLTAAVLRDAASWARGVVEDLATLVDLLRAPAVVPRQCCRTFEQEPHAGRCVAAGRRAS